MSLDVALLCVMNIAMLYNDYNLVSYNLASSPTESSENTESGSSSLVMRSVPSRGRVLD